MEKETKKCPYCGEEILAAAKKCKHCGEWLLETKKQETEKVMIACPVCGELIEENCEQCPHCKEKNSNSDTIAETAALDADKNVRSFFDYYLVEPFFRHYAKFRGRLNRKHYWVAMFLWFFVLFYLILSSILIFNTMSVGIGFLIILWYVVTIIPLYATATRRLRDVDSMPSTIAWFLLVTASPFLLFWTCKKSEDEDMRIDGLEPDIPQTVKFKKVDIIISTIILVLPFLIGVVSGAIKKGKDSDSKKDNIELFAAKSNNTAKLNDKEKKIVGEWHMTESINFEEEEIGISGSIELLSGYHGNKTTSGQGILRFSCDIDEDYYTNTVILEYKISVKGIWSVEGNYLVEKANEVNIDFNRASTVVENENDQEVIEYIKQGFANYIPEMRNDMLKKSREKIINLTDDEMTLRDDEGKEITAVRIR